ncbi:hypothetical protein NDU88_000872 [Pleurodeles waltl]|uniref:Uncharacterized protein n=1 Tax=Pleurodeles waltl TaxID=8319 RepID=A0AAV7TG12_PLEWA|nr:hypothetical protein NDU88_000872 [Pleurodeles waltl]
MARHPVRLPLLRVSLHNSKNVSRHSARKPPCCRYLPDDREGQRKSSNPQPGRTGPGRARVPGNKGGSRPTSTPAVGHRVSTPLGRESPGSRWAARAVPAGWDYPTPPALVGGSQGSLTAPAPPWPGRPAARGGPLLGRPEAPRRQDVQGIGVVPAWRGTSIRFYLPGLCRVAVGSVLGGAFSILPLPEGPDPGRNTPLQLPPV